MYLNTEAVSASDSDEDEEGLSSQNSEGAHLIVPDDDSGDSTNEVDKEYLSDSEGAGGGRSSRSNTSRSSRRLPSMTRCLEASRLHGKHPGDRRKSVN